MYLGDEFSLDMMMEGVLDKLADGDLLHTCILKPLTFDLLVSGHGLTNRSFQVHIIKVRTISAQNEPTGLLHGAIFQYYIERDKTVGIARDRYSFALFMDLPVSTVSLGLHAACVLEKCSRLFFYSI